jgi:hypothetical protein
VAAFATLANPAEKTATPGAETLAVLSNPAVSTAPAPALAATSTTAAAPTDPAAPAASPAAQIAPAMIQLVHTASGQQITIRLAPAELGRVDVRIGRADDGTASVQILVERPETLKLLQADQPLLNQALDKAGVPQEGRSLSLSLALPDPGGSSAGAGSFGGGLGGGQSGGARQPPSQPAAASSTTQDYPATPAPAWQRAGINITA